MAISGGDVGCRRLQAQVQEVELDRKVVAERTGVFGVQAFEHHPNPDKAEMIQAK